MNTQYPIFLNLSNRSVVVVGGGTVAEQKIAGLLAASAEVTVVAPGVTQWIESLTLQGAVTLFRRGYAVTDLEGAYLVIAATDNPEVQAAVHRDAEARRILVNVVDVPGLCNFTMASVFQKGDLKVAVSTNGKSPTLGKMIRDRIQEEFSEGYPELLETLGEMRPELHRAFPGYENRKTLFEQIVGTEVRRLQARVGKGTGNAIDRDLKKGTVYLVGAGPGDPELITVKGRRILGSADVVLYDALVAPSLLSATASWAENICVGKRAGGHATPQAEINALMIRKAKEGKAVVRLKGGDPFVFGRGGEEMEALRMHGVDVEIVPGITAGVGVPGVLGIPLTQREQASSVVFLTGHEDPAKTGSAINWRTVSAADTIVIYMGMMHIDSIVSEALQHGLPPDTPVAIVVNGTREDEEFVVGTLLDIEGKSRELTTNSPGIIIIGRVVQFLGSHSPVGEDLSPGSHAHWESSEKRR